ncbi:MAG: hypothetical protein L0H03_04350 [Rhodococcus sp. (in: high G+C Gram-positive bacteria)]|nr:hypothetical protein [Rhodococcus sp. (in: high G+C Gram-positive bacteria)]
MAIFAGHALYSIILCFYLLPEYFAFPLTEALTPDNLAIGLRTLWIIPLALWNLRRYDPTLSLQGNPSPVAFWAIIAALLYIALFQIDRSGSSEVYRVRVTPIYEYSYLLILLAYLFKGKNGPRTAVLIGICALIVAQDALYGGRATSVQVIFVLTLTMFRNRLSPIRLAALAVAGVIGGSLVGIVRSSGPASGNLLDVVGSSILESLMTSSTAVYAYYASLTHVAAAPNIESGERAASFMGFVQQVIFGGGESLTKYVSDNYFVNVGGGVFTSNFYFWGGPLAVALAGVCLSGLVRALGASKVAAAPALFIAFVASTPRWLLYSPSAALRPLLILFVVSVILGAFQARPFRVTPALQERTRSRQVGEGPVG